MVMRLVGSTVKILAIRSLHSVDTVLPGGYA
jgi:hypothetical protein